MDLKGKKILITGGSLGIGKATAKLLVEKGAQVAITGRTGIRLSEAAKETGAFPIVADVSEEADVKRSFDLFLDEFGKIDVLINNAGIGIRKNVDELKPDHFQKIFDVNVVGASMMAAVAAKHFKQQKSGSLINIGSTAGLKGYPGGSVYVASKFALRGLTECWRAELRPFNVRVMLINPSEVTTAFGNPERKERAEIKNKLRPLEIAHAIVSGLEMDERGFVPELSVWATNPFD
ncbi:MAG: SDR family oxidoreductase [Chitinophagales bacterium]